MAYFKDLSTYRYDSDESGVLNIGWLDDQWWFERGDTSPEFRRALGVLCQHPIRLHRGFHLCQFCNAWQGNGQIRVCGSEGVWYAAPTMVHHYVVAHSYRPPDEFLDAVLHSQAVGVEFHEGGIRCPISPAG